ncbi:MAG: PAS domain-containing protein, partial [Armatimonadota bacterium]
MLQTCRNCLNRSPVCSGSHILYFSGFPQGKPEKGGWSLRMCPLLIRSPNGGDNRDFSATMGAWEAAPAGNPFPEYSTVDLAHFQSIVDALREPVVVLDASLRVRLANRPFCALFRLVTRDALGHRIGELIAGPHGSPLEIESRLGGMVSTDDGLIDFPVTLCGADGSRRGLLLTASRWTPTVSDYRDYRGYRNSGLLLLTLEEVSERYRDIECTPAFRALQRAYEREKQIAQEFERPLT